MFVSDNARYSLLYHDPRAWSLDKKTVLLVSCLILPVILFCGTYMMLFGAYEKIIYPKIPFTKELLHRSLHRAVLYNKHMNDLNATKEFRINTNNDPPIESYKLVCYYNLPSSKYSLQPSDIDPNLCTHLNVAFASVINSTIYLEESQKGYLQDIVNIKKNNKDLKILLSIGGAGNEYGFPEMVSNHSNRKTFIRSVLDYVTKYKIDGIDLDWEFPGEDLNNDTRQRIHFSQLLIELRKTVEKQPKHPFLISVAVAATSDIIDRAYDVSYMNLNVDYVNLMSYDYHFYTKWTPFTGMNSPLYKISAEGGIAAILNINYSCNYWNYLGMDKNKIMVGLPTYGHTFRLVNSGNNGLYAPSLGYGKLGYQGFADFNQICTFLAQNRISPVFDTEALSPYATKLYEWVSFDDEQSLTYKAEYIREHKFGGAMVYSLNTDDFRGNCRLWGRNGKRFPLLRKVKKVLNSKDYD